MKRLDETKLLPGDIVLSTADQSVSKAIRTATRSDISHAMIYVARCSIIDSTGEGVHARNTQRIFFDDDCAVQVRRAVTGLSDRQRDLVIDFVRSRIGVRYTKREAIRSALGGAKNASARQFCSRLVAQAYAWAGLNLVDAPDFCTPDHLKNSPLLVAVEDAVVVVSDDDVARMEQDLDTNEAIRAATNKLLDAARSRNSKIESLHDIDAYLISTPAEDERFAKFYDESGYLSAWAAEFDKNRWQYELPLLVAMAGSKLDKQTYCLQVIEDHGDLISRRSDNRVGYTILHAEYGLRTFRKLRALYDLLVDLQFARRVVALEWLKQFAPETLPGPAHTESLVPHTEEWFAVITRQNPLQAQITRTLIQCSGSTDICTFCGDESAVDHRYVGHGLQPATVVTCKLCEDCREIRKVQFGEEYSRLEPSAQ